MGIFTVPCDVCGYTFKYYVKWISVCKRRATELQMWSRQCLNFTCFVLFMKLALIISFLSLRSLFHFHPDSFFFFMCQFYFPLPVFLSLTVNLLQWTQVFSKLHLVERLWCQTLQPLIRFTLGRCIALHLLHLTYVNLAGNTFRLTYYVFIPVKNTLNPGFLPLQDTGPDTSK